MLIKAYADWMTLAGRRPRTIEERVKYLTCFEHTLGDRHIGEATRLDCQAHLARQLSLESRRTYLGHLRGLFRWAVEEQYVQTDPTLRIPSVRVPKGVPRPIDTADLTKAVLHADTRMRAWLLLMALGGLRAMEVAGMRPQDLVQHDTGVLLFLREAKGGGTGSVPAHPEVLAALADVPIRNGLWWDCTAHYVSVKVSAYMKSLEIDATGHQLRHYSGTSWLRASGEDLLTTSRLMRHASVATTQTYTQLVAKRPAEVVNLVPYLRAV